MKYFYVTGLIMLFLITGCGKQASSNPSGKSNSGNKPISTQSQSVSNSQNQQSVTIPSSVVIPATTEVCRFIFNGYAEYKGGSLDVYKNNKKIGTIYSLQGGKNKQLFTLCNNGDTFRVEWKPAPDGQFMDSRFAVSVWNLQKGITSTTALLPESLWQSTSKSLVYSVGGAVGPNQAVNVHNYVFKVNKLVGK